MKTKSHITNTIRYAYVAGQCISIGSSFVGSMFAIYDYKNSDTGTRAPELISDYLWTFGFAALAAALGGFTAYKFQGIKIGGEDNENSPAQYGYEHAPRNWRSNLVESIYLVFTNSFAFVYNYFLIAAILAMYASLRDPTHNYPIVPLNAWGYLALFIKTLVIDAPFDLTNSDYQACEEIKRDITKSEEGPLISIFIKPFSKKPFYTPTITWIKTAGTASHVITDYIGTLLSTPPIFIISLYQHSPEALFSLVTFIGIISIPLLFVNYIQTLYFEAKISEIKLDNLKNEGVVSLYPRFNNKQKPSLLRGLLKWQPRLKKPIYYGFYTQGIIHGGSDVMPVVLFLRDFFNRQDWSSLPLHYSVIIPLAGFVFMSSALGTHFSEVTEAMKHYNEDFSDIGTDDETDESTSNLCCCF